MEDYSKIILDSFSGYWNYLIREIMGQSSTGLWYENYFYWLIVLSLLVWFLEVLLPWRKDQKLIRKDFWLDTFYMFFNFFLFSLIIYNAVSNVGVALFNDLLQIIGVENMLAIEIKSWPQWAQFATLFIIADFIQWNTHRLLHRLPWLWKVHKVHHSVKEMGFAAHLRFHWLETVIYKSIMFIPLSMIGYEIKDIFIYYMLTLLIGHLNHANIKLSYGPLKYILNNPVMHIWHHAKKLPNRYGVNFGISLSLWDYLFQSDYIPSDGRDVELGFEDDDEFPQDFIGHSISPFKE